MISRVCDVRRVPRQESHTAGKNARGERSRSDRVCIMHQQGKSDRFSLPALCRYERLCNEGCRSGYQNHRMDPLTRDLFPFSAHPLPRPLVAFRGALLPPSPPVLLTRDRKGMLFPIFPSVSSIPSREYRNDWRGVILVWQGVFCDPVNRLSGEDDVQEGSPQLGSLI